jgi:hypothetical protein
MKEEGKMPNCIHCGAEISGELRFCPNCNKEITQQPTGQPFKLKRKIKISKDNNSQKLQSIPWAIPVQDQTSPQPHPDQFPNYYPYQYPSPHPPPYPYVDPNKEKAKDYGLYGIIAGIIGLFVLGFVLGALAIYFGTSANKLDRSQGMPAIVLGVIDIIATIIVMIFLFPLIFSP